MIEKIGDKIQIINKQTSDEWRLVQPHAIGEHGADLLHRSGDHLPSLPDLIKQLPKLLSEKMLLDETSLQNAVWDQDYWKIITHVLSKGWYVSGLVK